MYGPNKFSARRVRACLAVGTRVVVVTDQDRAANQLVVEEFDALQLTGAITVEVSAGMVMAARGVTIVNRAGAGFAVIDVYSGRCVEFNRGSWTFLEDTVR